MSGGRPYTPPCAVLVVPAADGRKLTRALDSAADEVVADLEDSVIEALKVQARAAIAPLASGGASGPRLAVRINSIGTEHCHLDVGACVRARAVDSIVVPKVENDGDIAFLDRLLAGMEAEAKRDSALGIQVLIESAAGLANVRSILRSSARIRSVVIGYADLAVSLGRVGNGDWNDRAAIQLAVLVAAREAGIAALDGPLLTTVSDDRLTESATTAAELGFDGKWVIHPSQIEAVASAFMPSAEQLAWAHSVLDAMGDAAKDGRGAMALDGSMLDEAVVKRARRVIERASAKRRA